MAPARRLLSVLVVATLAAVALVAWQGARLRFAAGEHPGPALRPTLTVTSSPPGPAVSDKLAPREGAWWGSYPGQAAGDVEAREAVYGRRVDILHRYHDWDDAWPTAEERAYAAQGRFLFEGWESRVFGGPPSAGPTSPPASTTPPSTPRRGGWPPSAARCSSASYTSPRTTSDPAGRARSTTPRPTWARPGSSSPPGGTSSSGVRPVAPKVVWVLSLMGHDPAGSWALYPGDEVVDWVAWDPYNWANCAGRSRDGWRSLQQVAQPMYDHLDAVGNTTPRMLGEYGSHDDPAMGSKERWLRDVPGTLRTALPKVRAVVYFDRVDARVPGDPCAWLADSSAAARAGFAAAGADSYLNQPHI